MSGKVILCFPEFSLESIALNAAILQIFAIQVKWGSFPSYKFEHTPGSIHPFSQDVDV